MEPSRRRVQYLRKLPRDEWFMLANKCNLFAMHPKVHYSHTSKGCGGSFNLAKVLGGFLPVVHGLLWETAPFAPGDVTNELCSIEFILAENWVDESQKRELLPWICWFMEIGLMRWMSHVAITRSHILLIFLKLLKRCIALYCDQQPKGSLITQLTNLFFKLHHGQLLISSPQWKQHLAASEQSHKFITILLINNYY